MSAPREDTHRHPHEAEHRDEAPSDPEEELAPAFDVDLDPEDQGSAEAASESTG